MKTQKKPNVVFILVDNLGWGDLGCYGGLAPTPRLDQLADEGMRFKNYYVEAQCTPTRSAIMTGRQPKRSETTSVPLTGKWHLGDQEGRLPTDQGFDEWFGIKNTTDEAGYTSYPMFHKTGYPAPSNMGGSQRIAVAAGR